MFYTLNIAILGQMAVRRFGTTFEKDFVELVIHKEVQVFHSIGYCKVNHSLPYLQIQEQWCRCSPFLSKLFITNRITDNHKQYSLKGYRKTT